MSDQPTSQASVYLRLDRLEKFLDWLVNYVKGIEAGETPDLTELRDKLASVEGGVNRLYKLTLLVAALTCPGRRQAHVRSFWSL